MSRKRTAPKATPVHRAEVQVLVKKAVRAELHERDMFPADLAPSTGISEREMERRLDPQDGGKHLQVADLVLLDDELFTAVIARIAGARGLVVVRVPEGGAIADVVEHHERATEAVHEHLLARADQKITRAEAGPLKAAALAELRVAGAVVALADRALEEGCVDLTAATDPNQH